MKARLIAETGTRAWLRIYWGRECQARQLGYHNAERFLAESDQVGDWALGGIVENYPDATAWPQACDGCKAPVPDGAFLNRSFSFEARPPIYQVFHRRRYGTASGDPEPGDLFWATWMHEPERRDCLFWDDCTDPRGHLYAILPTGAQWDIDSRASNCTMKADRRHRCWVRHGEPPAVHVDKAGVTCQGGAGSIVVPGWHGFLDHGEFHT